MDNESRKEGFDYLSSSFGRGRGVLGAQYWDLQSDGSRLSFGRGRGVVGVHSQLRGAVGGDVGASPVLPVGDRGLGSGQDRARSPMEQMSQGGPRHSTPSGETDTLHQLSDMIFQLGSQIGESIAARLMSSGAIGNIDQNATPSPNQTTRPSSDVVMPSDNRHINVIVKSEREPVVFRGDSSDKCTVIEWVDLMKSYIRRQNYDVSVQAEEIMGRLMGKARDVVRIGLRSDPSLNITDTPGIIYDILMHNFSSTSSCLPLQDFYSTLPTQRETPIDYWIRLNKAADLAEEGLRRQGRHMDNMGGEIAKMFVKHCPDPELASVFKYKQIHEWTLKEIQARIDEHQREWVSSVKAHMTKTHAAALYCNETRTDPHSTCDMLSSSADSLSPPALSRDVVQSVSPVLPQGLREPFPPALQGQQLFLPTMSQNQQALSPLQQFQRPLLPSMPQSQLPPGPQRGNDPMLGEMMSMLKELLTTVKAGDGRRGGRQSQNRTPPVRETNCRVCNDVSHTTESHCRSARLCFACFKPGHTRRSCDSVQGN